MKILGTCCMGEIEKGGISEMRKVRKKGKRKKCRNGGKEERKEGEKKE